MNYTILELISAPDDMIIVEGIGDGIGSDVDCYGDLDGFVPNGHRLGQDVPAWSPG
jgi:hypothetical protein